MKLSRQHVMQVYHTDFNRNHSNGFDTVTWGLAVDMAKPFKDGASVNSI
jgi:hypothetical protein